MNRAAAWFVHLYTASGVAFALLATLALFAGAPDVKRIFILLTIAVLIDATDGPMARRVGVKTVLPEIDGRKIDDIVDYLTFTFVPLALAVRMEWVPSVWFVIPALIASLLGFANTGAKDETGGFFLGFPSYWNIAVFYFGIIAARGGSLLNGIVTLVLAVLTVLPIGFIYPNLAPPRWKALILGGAFVWLVMLVAMFPRYPNPPQWLVIASLVYPVFYVGVSMTEYRKSSRA